MSRAKDVVSEYFISKGELFRVIMDSRDMAARAKRIAKGVAKQLMMMGLESGYVLDVGCGTGRIAIELAKLGFNVVGIDISPRYIEIAIKRVKEYGLENKARFYLCDARNIEECDIDPKMYDVIVFVWSSVIGYYDEDTDIRILTSLRKMVKSSGVLFFADFVNKDYISIEKSVIGSKTIAYDYDDLVVLERTLFNPITSEILINQRFYRKHGRDLLFVDEASFKMRIYSLSELVNIARKSGWCLNKVLEDIAGDPGYTILRPLNVVFVSCEI